MHFIGNELNIPSYFIVLNRGKIRVSVNYCSPLMVKYYTTNCVKKVASIILNQSKYEQVSVSSGIGRTEGLKF